MKAVEQENLTCLGEREASCDTWGFHIGCANFEYPGEWEVVHVYFKYLVCIKTRTELFSH